MAAELMMEIRLLPRATPELEAIDHLWRFGKEKALASRLTQAIDTSADQGCRYILEMSREERRRRAGMLSGRFWLADLP